MDEGRERVILVVMLAVVAAVVIVAVLVNVLPRPEPVSEEHRRDEGLPGR